MTNREYLVSALTDKIDDGGATKEMVLIYNIACPYSYTDERALCRGVNISRERCVQCKEKWLNAEVEE